MLLPGMANLEEHMLQLILEEHMLWEHLLKEHNLWEHMPKEHMQKEHMLEEHIMEWMTILHLQHLPWTTMSLALLQLAMLPQLAMLLQLAMTHLQAAMLHPQVTMA